LKNAAADLSHEISGRVLLFVQRYVEQREQRLAPAELALGFSKHLPTNIVDAVFNLVINQSNMTNMLHCNRRSPIIFFAGWSSLAARRAHNPKVIGSNPIPATKD
jgi:hypothetical protein